MITAWRRKLNHNNFDTSFVKIDQVLIVLWRLKGKKVPISIVAVNRIDLTDWLDIMVDDLNHWSPHVLIFLRNLILLFSQCMEMNRWLSLHFFTYSIAQFWSILSWIRILASSIPIRQHRWFTVISLYWKSKNFSSSDTFKKKLTFSNYTFPGVKITTCSFPHIGKSN